MSTSPVRVAVIGAGISGITAAHVLKKHGFEVVVYEKADQPGGVWAVAYPQITLQNLRQHYHLSDFPWPFEPDLHPTGAQVMRYWQAVIRKFQLDVRLEHTVLGMEELPDGWRVQVENAEGVREETFGYVMVSVGQYTEGKYRPLFPGEEFFGGQIVTEREVRSLDMFDGKRVAVVGFGKSALDMATFAAKRGAVVQHVFRTPRWTVPEWILGVHFTHALFNRFGTVMMTSWAHPTAAERFLHKQMKGVVDSFWDMIASVFRGQIQRLGKDEAAKARLKAVIPTHKLPADLRSAAALAPVDYYPLVAAGKIQPTQAEMVGVTPTGVCLKDGREVPAELVVLSLGSETPKFPFLPEKYRRLLEAEPDGAQLYRHLIHPRIPRMGFAGFNHGYMHIPAVEVGTLWQIALLRGELTLPPLEEMERSIERVRAWKREHIHFEPSRSCAVSTRFQQYIDIVLKDLGISPYRKLPNVVAEVFGRYQAADYRGVGEEYGRRRGRRLVGVDT